MFVAVLSCSLAADRRCFRGLQGFFCLNVVAHVVCFASLSMQNCQREEKVQVDLASLQKFLFSIEAFA